MAQAPQAMERASARPVLPLGLQLGSRSLVPKIPQTLLNQTMRQTLCRFQVQIQILTLNWMRSCLPLNQHLTTSLVDRGRQILTRIQILTLGVSCHLTTPDSATSVEMAQV